MLMVAIKECGYLGRRIKPGRTFEVSSVRDATVLRVAGLARNAKVSDVQQVLPAQTPKAQVMALPSPLPPPSTAIPDDDLIDYSDQSAETQGDELEVETSPPDGKSRKRRRHYKRRDMVPEK